MCKQITGYFFRLSSRRTPDGKKDYLRRPDGRRAVLSPHEARLRMLDAIRDGNLEARLRPVRSLIPDSEVKAMVDDMRGANLSDPDYGSAAAQARQSEARENERKRRDEVEAYSKTLKFAGGSVMTAEQVHDETPAERSEENPVRGELIATGQVLPEDVAGQETPMSQPDVRLYTYRTEVRGPDGIIHRAGEVVRQVKVRGYWRDEDTSSAKEFEAAWRAAIIKSQADLTDEDRRVLRAAEAE